MLTPKIGIGKGLTCGPSLVMKCHSTGKISSEDSVKMLVVGNTLSFGRRTVWALKKGSFRECVMTWPGYKEGTNWWRVRDGHWRRSINLGIKCCTRSRPGVVLGQGYKYKPLMSIIGIEHLHNKTSPVPNFESFSRVIEFFERSHRSIDLRKYRNLVSCLVSCSGFRPWCK
jgi:hypothetical protein